MLSKLFREARLREKQSDNQFHLSNDRELIARRNTFGKNL